MEPLIDILSIVATCADLSVDMEQGEVWPRLIIRQGPGFYQCTALGKTALPYTIYAVPGLFLFWVARRAMLNLRRRRRARF